MKTKKYDANALNMLLNSEVCVSLDAIAAKLEAALKRLRQAELLIVGRDQIPGPKP
jgi:hypothetical protein